MTLIEAITEHMEENNLSTANGINICQLIIDKKVEVQDCYKELIHSYKNSKKNLNDGNVGSEMWFEYHCLESHESCDSEIWYRSHQKVLVLSITHNGGGNTPKERSEDGDPRVYKVRFIDGFEYDVFEDELMDDPSGFYRPNPPQRKIKDNLNQQT